MVNDIERHITDAEELKLFPNDIYNRYVDIDQYVEVYAGFIRDTSTDPLQRLFIIEYRDYAKKPGSPSDWYTRASNPFGERISMTCNLDECQLTAELKGRLSVNGIK